MTKTEITKAVVRNMTGYSIGAAASVFLSTNRKHSDNPAVETLIDVSTVVTGIAVSGVVHEPVGTYTDAQIDKIVAWYNENVKK